MMNLIKLYKLPRRIYERLYSRLIVTPSIGRCGKNLNCKPNVNLENPERIFLGNNVVIGKDSLLMAIKRDRTGVEFDSQIFISDSVNIGPRAHITAARNLIIGGGVLMGSNVLISDSNHTNNILNRPPIEQRLSVAKIGISIGENTWIGNNAVILGDVSIGKNCIIGANATIVNKKIPDFSVVVGNPGVIKLPKKGRSK